MLALTPPQTRKAVTDESFQRPVGAERQRRMPFDFRSLAPALATVLCVIFIAWAITDARRRGRTGGAIVLLLALFGPLSALLWLVMRPNTTVIDRGEADYDNADDALAAAAQLDHLGEWRAAAVLYQHAAARWPEHRPYVVQCLALIWQKQAM
jgi:hypothetical protein